MNSRSRIFAPSRLLRSFRVRAPASSTTHQIVKMISAAALSGYVLVPATEAQDLVATKREWVEWGQPLLTQEQFVTREKTVLGTSDFSTTRRQRWVLVPADDTTTEDFLSACETYRRPIMLKRPGNDELERALSYSVCSVFVPENKRRNGYASKMLCLLQQSLSPQGKVPGGLDEQKEVKGSRAEVAKLNGDAGELRDGGKYGGNATCSFLYSDIGEYYSQFGWRVVGNRHVEWKPLSTEDKAMQLPDEARWLRQEDLNELGALDRSYLVSQLQKPSSAIRFCVDDPEATSWRWLIKRSNYYAVTLLPESAPKPAHFGLLLPPADEGGEVSYAVWMFDFIERKVAVLRLRFASPKAFHSLVGAVRAQAREFGMNKCVAWNVDLASLSVELTEEDEAELRNGERVERFANQLQGGAVVERKGNGASLPALAWFGDKEEGEQIEWVCNEYGWWC